MQVQQEANERTSFTAALNERRCARTPLYGHDVVAAVAVDRQAGSLSVAVPTGIVAGQRPTFATAVLRSVLTARRPTSSVCTKARQSGRYFEYCNALRKAVLLPEERAQQLDDLLQAFVFAIPKVRGGSCVKIHH